METSNLQTAQRVNFSIFPNPTADYFQVNGIVGSAKLVISNIHCKVFLTKDEIVNDDIICLKSIPKGIYILKIISENGIERKKLEKI
ncbi:MAG: T9SS type A sorting domain-containing protein [Paludibacter sp.]|nr:T9SS type A sorting domain-containing protein [Paludibacter sp.]